MLQTPGSIANRRMRGARQDSLTLACNSLNMGLPTQQETDWDDPMTVINSIADRADELKGWRRELHQHPEICYEEVWTSDFVAAKLESFGIEVHRGIGKTGVVGVLRGNGGSDRAIGLRADIDALPMRELNEFEHKSKIPGRMHACGHDGHSTILLGTAKYLAETRNFDGTVNFIFQPAAGLRPRVMLLEVRPVLFRCFFFAVCGG